MRQAAFVALRPGRGVVPDNLIEHCLGSLARYKVPREVSHLVQDRGSLPVLR